VQKTRKVLEFTGMYDIQEMKVMRGGYVEAGPSYAKAAMAMR
jgi:hypothetical protein